MSGLLVEDRPALSPSSPSPPIRTPRPTEGHRRPSHAGRSSGWPVAVVILAVLPLVVPAIAMIVHHPHIDWSGDQALTELAVREAAGGHQLLGMGGRFGWNHPGPLWIYLLLPAYELTGRAPWSLGLGAITLHIVMIVIVVVAAGRAAGPRAAAVLAALVVIYIQATGLIYWTNLWAGYAFVWPLLALIVMGAVATSLADASWGLPAIVLLGTLLVQTDVSTAVPVVLISIVAVSLRLRRFGLRSVVTGRNGGHSALSRPSVSVAAVVVVIAAVLTWVPPIIQQLTHDPGNFTLLYRYARQGSGGYPFRTAAAAVGASLTVMPLGARWILRNGVQPHIDPGPWWAVGVTVAFIAGTAATTVFAWRRRRRLAGDLALFSLVGAIAGIVSISRVDGAINFYLLTWITVLPVPAMAGLLLTVAPSRRRGEYRTTFDPVVVGAAAVAAVVALVVVVGQGTTNNWDRVGSARVARQTLLLDQELGPIRTGAIRIHIITADTWTDAAGVALQLERQGARIEVDPDWVFLFGNAFHPRDFAPPYPGPAIELWFARAHERPAVTDQRGLIDLGSIDGISVLGRRDLPS